MEITIIVNFILGVILPFVLFVVAGYLILTYRDERILNYVRIAVKAAEQLYSATENKEKFEYVAKWISAKFKISTEDLKNLIESAVYELKSDKVKSDTEPKE